MVLTLFSYFLFLGFDFNLFASTAIQSLPKCIPIFSEILLGPSVKIGNVRVFSAINRYSQLVKEAEFAARDQRIQSELNNLINQEIQGNLKPNMGRFALGKGYYELRGAHGARIYIKRFEHEDGTTDIIIVGKATKKGSANDSRVFRLMRRIYSDFPEPPVGMRDVRQR